ncbi:MAG: hypothetical protein AB8H86_28855 [Polyangiales bacterium]
MRLQLLVFAFLAACGSAETHGPSGNHQMQEEPISETASAANAETPPGTAPLVVEGFFSGEGAPRPQACDAASDCIGDTIPDVQNPCCNNPRSLRPYSRAYRQWVGEWRAAECGGVECPPPPAPAMPADCSFEMQCVEGTCTNQC